MDNFRSSLKFLFYVLRLCCLNAIDLSSRADTRFKVSKLWIGYSIVASASYGYFHIATAQVDLKTAKGANFVTTLIDYYNKYSGLILFVTCIFVTLARQKSLGKLLAILEDHDSTLKKYFDGKVNYGKHARTPIYYISFYALAIGYFEYSNCIMYIQDYVTFNDFCILMCIIPLWISIATLIQFVYFLIIIRSRLQLLSDLLKEHKLSPMEQHLNNKINYWPTSKHVLMVQSIESGTGANAGDEKEKKSEKIDMKIIQMLHEKLHTTIVLLSSIFGVQLVAMITVQFITLTTLSYFTCMQVIRISSRETSASSDEIQAIIGTGLWIVLFLMKIFTLCYHCQRIKEQAEACGHYVHHYQISKRYLAEKHEIKMFSVQIIQQNFIISPGGLFHLDMAMGFSIIGATTTYIIILIQFDISQN